MLKNIAYLHCWSSQSVNRIPIQIRRRLSKKKRRNTKKKLWGMAGDQVPAAVPGSSRLSLLCRSPEGRGFYITYGLAITWHEADNQPRKVPMVAKGMSESTRLLGVLAPEQDPPKVLSLRPRMISSQYHPVKRAPAGYFPGVHFTNC